MNVAIGIDIGGTTIKAGLISQHGEVLESCTYATPDTISDLLNCIATICVERTEAFNRLDGDLTLAETVGLASLGVVDEQAGELVVSANKGWSNVAIRDLAQAQLGRHVVLGHDVGSGAVGEAVFGAGRDHNHCIFFPIGTGMSAAEVIDGHAHKPSPWMGEIGQIQIHNPDCNVPERLHCGQPRGTIAPITTVEQAFSSIAIGRRYGNLLARQAANTNNPTNINDAPTVAYTTRDVFARASDGCELAAWVIDSALDGQALSAANVCAMTGANGLILGGGITNAGQAFLLPFSTKLQQYLGILPMPTVRIATLGPLAQMIGIGYRALQAERADHHLPSLPTPSPIGAEQGCSGSTVASQTSVPNATTPTSGVATPSHHANHTSAGPTPEEPSCH